MATLLLTPAEGWGALWALLGAFGPLSLLPPQKIQNKSKMTAMVPKWLPVIYMGVISLSSEFQPYSSKKNPRWPPCFLVFENSKMIV